MCSGSNGSLIDLDDISFGINEEGGRQTHVAVPVEKIAIENVVNAGDIIRAAQDENRRDDVACKRFVLCRRFSAGSSTFMVSS